MKKLSILIAEDEILTRLDLKEMLLAAGHLVCGETNNGQKAVELAKQVMPDLVILDIKMPGMDGIEVAKNMQMMNIPAILLTAYSQQNLISRAEKVSVYGYLVKPITERDLLPAVQIAYARWKEMQCMQQELKETQSKLKNQKILAHARAILAKQHGISEYEAHQLLVHEAMQQRVTLIEKAVQIVKHDKHNP